MRFLILVPLLVLASCATQKGLDPSRLPAQFEIELEKEIHADFNHDNIEDSVKILPAPRDSNYHILEISLSNKTNFEKFENHQLVYAAAIPGASLEAMDNGSFKILIDHSGGGRSASLREYTVSYRHDKFVLSGVTVSDYDRVDPELGGSCDINLLTGEGERNSKAIKVKIEKKDFVHADYEWLPRECKF